MTPDRTTPSPDRQTAIIDTFVHLSDTLVESYDVIDFLHYLTERCVELLDVAEAGVMLASPTGNLQAVAASSERTRSLELYELQNHDGPCLDAYRTGETVMATDLARERERWPMFARHALDVGFAGVHSVPLRLRDEIIGALNLLRISVGALPSLDASLVRALADIATIGVLQERTIRASEWSASGLQIALTSRIRIEQAKGILAARSAVSVDAAFDVLRSYARRHQLGITTAARMVVDGELDIDVAP